MGWCFKKRNVLLLGQKLNVFLEVLSLLGIKVQSIACFKEVINENALKIFINCLLCEWVYYELWTMNYEVENEDDVDEEEEEEDEIEEDACVVLVSLLIY